MNIGDKIRLENVEGIEDTGLSKGVVGVANNVVTLASGSGTSEKYVLFCPEGQLNFTWMSVDRFVVVGD